MNTSDNSELEAYLPVYDSTPEKWEDARGFITEQLKRIANAVNIREIGWFLDEELISGKQFIPAVTPNSRPQQFRTVFRKVVDVNGLSNGVHAPVPHGINFDSRFTLVSLWGAATDPVNLLALQFSFAGVPTGNNIQLYIDSTYIQINCQTDRTSYTRAFVTIEYMQQINEP